MHKRIVPFDVYESDTTYCYHINQSLHIDVPDHNYILQQGRNMECPLLIDIQTITNKPFYLSEKIHFEFQAYVNLHENIFGLKQLYPLHTKYTTIEIPHSNIHACKTSLLCDIFTAKGNRFISTQEQSNFTNEIAIFRQSITFKKEGEYHAFAHIILASTNTLSYYHIMKPIIVGTIAKNRSSRTSISSNQLPTIVLVIVIIIIGISVCTCIIYFILRKPKGYEKSDNPSRRHDKTQPISIDATCSRSVSNHLWYTYTNRHQISSQGYLIQTSDGMDTKIYSDLPDCYSHSSNEYESISENTHSSCTCDYGNHTTYGRPPSKSYPSARFSYESEISLGESIDYIDSLSSDTCTTFTTCMTQDKDRYIHMTMYKQPRPLAFKGLSQRQLIQSGSDIFQFYSSGEFSSIDSCSSNTESEYDTTSYSV